MRTTCAVSAPAAAWAALGDPARLAAALPGCRSVTRDGVRPTASIGRERRGWVAGTPDWPWGGQPRLARQR